jgi:medium-chain acyl-[acyl-carrier-protein] hydrolase
MATTDLPSELPPRHREAYRVRTYEADPYGRASVRTLLLLLQEVATAHAQLLDIAVRYLIDNRLAWVLTRLKLEVNRWPHGGETITVETWPHAASRLMIERRFSIWGEDGSETGEAATMWIVMDLDRRRPVRLPPFILDALRPIMSDESLVSLEKIPAAEEPSGSRLFEVRYADLDMVHHVNNAAYVQWAAETTPEQLWGSHIPAGIDVHYLAECRFGDTVESQVQDVGNGSFLHLLRRRSDGAEVLRARTRWERVAEGQ